MRHPIILAFGLGFALALAHGAPTLAAPPTILIDGKEITSDVPAIGDADHMLVPLRIFEQLGATVSFDATAGSADIQWRGIEAKVYSGSPVAWVDGARMVLKAAPREFAGRMEVPISILSQVFNADADYDPGTNTIAIVTGQAHGNFVATISGPSSGAYSNSVPSLPTTPTYSSAPEVSDLQPAPQSTTGSTYPQIYARFGGGDSSVDPNSVRLTIDGADVTNLAAISSAYVSYTPNAGLSNGSHSVTLSGQTLDGQSIDQTWTFTVDSGSGYNYAASVIGYAPTYGYGSYGYGYRRYGFCPPGFSLYSPGPLWLYGGNVVEVIFFSRYFPYGNGFFTIGGFPGQYALQPWYGYPGYYWGMVSVPFGIHARSSVLAAHFKTDDGRNVVVHSTAPLHIDGTRRSPPSDVRYAVMPTIVNRPASPHVAVSFHPMPVDRSALIGVRAPRSAMPDFGQLPVQARQGMPGVSPGRETYPAGPIMGMPLPRAAWPIMPGPRMPMPAPRPVPAPKPIPHPKP